MDSNKQELGIYFDDQFDMFCKEFLKQLIDCKIISHEFLEIGVWNSSLKFMGLFAEVQIVNNGGNENYVEEES